MGVTMRLQGSTNILHILLFLIFLVDLRLDVFEDPDILTNIPTFIFGALGLNVVFKSPVRRLQPGVQ